MPLLPMTKRILLFSALVLLFVSGTTAQDTDDEEIVTDITEDTTDIVPQVPMSWDESLRFRLDSMLARHRTATVTVRTRKPVRRGRRRRRSYVYTTRRKTITLRDRIGIAVWDLTADSMLYTHNSRELYIPASNQKIFVAVAALDDLGMSYHFKTDIRTDMWLCRDTDDHEYAKGKIYIHDHFDPTLDKEAAEYIAQKLLGIDVDSIDGEVVSYVPLRQRMPGMGWFWNRHASRSIAQNVVAQLKDDGISFRDKTPYSTVSSPLDSIGELYTSLATPLPVVLKRMMKNSDNAYAESVLLSLVRQDSTWSYEACKERVRDVIRKAGANISDYIIHDGSGLSHGNRTTPEVLVAVLRYAYNNPKIYRPLLESMPQAGLDGTLGRRMRNTLAHGNVRAKTGTVNGVSTLSGYLKAQNGHLLAFSILMNDISGNHSAHALQNILCVEMCR